MVRLTWASAALRVPAGRIEFLEPWQRGVVVFQRLVEPRHGLGLEQLEPRDRQLAAQVEQLVLDDDQQLAHIGRQRLGQQDAQARIELVHMPHGIDAQVVFRYPRAVTQPGAAIVAGAGGDLRESVGHMGAHASSGGMDRLLEWPSTFRLDPP